MSQESSDIKHMVKMLKQGATLTELACPACSSPLFRFKSGEIWCGKCEKQVIVVKQGEDPAGAATKAQLATLESTVLTKIKKIEQKIEKEENSEELQKLNNTLASLLDSLSRLKKMKES